MNDVKKIDATILQTFSSPNSVEIDALLQKELSQINKKIVVLDDDPTGVQTVHGIHVYTDWEEDTLIKGFEEQNSMFFVLTNSRGFTAAETTKEHIKMAKSIVTASKVVGKDFIVISRSDSTLRGHYPLETQILKREIEQHTDKRYDGEIIFPFFKEGGRFTIDNVHYVKEGDMLVPAGMTEFAKDKTFGYTSSHLGDWCEEKTKGEYKAENMVYISLESLRAWDYQRIEQQLVDTKDFNKIIVNAIDYIDVKIFVIALLRALSRGKQFMFRSAAAVTKVLGGVSDKPLLEKSELVPKGNSNGGIILVGSHVNKTTMQLEKLKDCRYPIEFIKFNQHLVLQDGGLEGEVERVVAVAENKIKSGVTVAVYTRRDRFDLPDADKDKQLEVSVKISNAVTSIIGRLNIRPNFIIAKGGITSSDVGTKALKVKRALVMGQIRPGIPVWMTGEESKFPGMPYIIFPGNVGEVTDLCTVVETLME